MKIIIYLFFVLIMSCENNIESETHKDASPGDLSEEELADRYYLFVFFI